MSSLALVAGCGASEDHARHVLRGVTLVAAEEIVLPLAVPGDAVVELSGEVPGAGILTVSVERLEAASSRSRGAALTTLATAGGAVRLRVPLEEPREDRYELSIAWEGEAPLTLDSLIVRDSNPPTMVPIIWINVDTLSARHSNVFGYPRATTPCLARLAGESILFERSRANAPWTLPSTMSQLTGVLPQAFLTVAPTGGVGWQVPAARWTIAESLRSGGYATAAFIDNPYLQAAYGVAQGFETWDTESAEVDRSDPRGGLAHMTPRMLAWLDGLAPDAPFFLFLQPFDVHGPYVPAAENARLFEDDGLTAELGSIPVAHGEPGRGAVISAFARHRPGADPDEPVPARVELGPLVDAYDRSVRTLDDALAGFVEALRARGILDRAVLIVSADHGESTSRHEAFFEHKEPWEDVLHVPLLIRLPGGEHGGRRVAENVQGVDIYPTIKELAGLAHTREYLDGISLVGACAGRPLPQRDHFAYAEEQDTLACVRGDWKLLYRRPRVGDPFALLQLPELRRWREESLGLARNAPVSPEQLRARIEEHPEREALLQSFYSTRAEALAPRAFLFDLSADPCEQHDLAATRPELVADLRRSGLEQEALALAAQQDAAVTGQAHGPDAGMQDILRALGYAGGR